VFVCLIVYLEEKLLEDSPSVCSRFNSLSSINYLSEHKPWNMT